MLAKPFIVGEHKGLIPPDWPSQSSPELIPLKPGNGRRIEEIACVENAIPQEFVQRAMEQVGAGLGDDQDLRSRTLAVPGVIGVSQHVELPHRVDAKKFLAGSTRLKIVLGGASEF